MQKITNESALLQASLAGSTEAFGSIIERYQSLICGITYSSTGDLSKSEELAQETFIRAWKGLAQLKDVSNFRAWLCTIARNVIRTSIKRGQQDAIDAARPLEAAERMQSAEPGPAERVISKEQQAVVWQALQTIPQSYREPMVLFYREQQSVSEVAAGLGLSEDAAKQRLSRGRKLLKTEVAVLVEDVLGQTGPSKVFAVAVVAALPALTAQTATAAATGVATKGAPAVKTALLSGFSRAVLGPLVGLLGGIFGTWMSIKHTKSARERRFMVKMGIAGWLALLLLIAVPLVLAVTGVIPGWGYWVLFAVFFALLLPLIIWGNARQRLIQIEDGTYAEPEHGKMKLTKANVYGAFGGSIFGPVCWVFVISFISKDWLIALTVFMFAVILFVISAKICLREQGKYWRIVITDMMAIALLTFAVVNLRWGKWMEFYRDGSSRFDMPLWGINVMIAAIFSGLLGLFVLMAGKERKEQKEAAEDEK